MEKGIILVGDGRLLVKKKANGEYCFPKDTDVSLRSGSERFSFGRYVVVSADNFEEMSIDTSIIPIGLREAWEMFSGEDYAAAVKGAELSNWSSETRYCSRCGAHLERATEISKRCPECRMEFFPQLSPAIVVLVKRGEEALLVHARNFKRPEVMALVAGFVETGESLEECVAREIKEETDIDVTDIRYVGSQSWPFPHQMMLGFVARYAGGEIKFADHELSDGGFFTRDNVPPLPTPPSLSREIIDRWLNHEL
ncbi:MAG: NAD(+) diphosphatase [Bacteroides sp.]|nr:NAD(+) diphosphatase [Bacteroides sp.]